MRNVIIAFLCFFTLSFLSCDSSIQEGNTEITDTLNIIDSNQQKDIFDAYLPELKTLVKNDSGFFRGKDFTMSQKACIENNLELLEQAPNSLTYGIKFDAINEGDITYVFNNKNILSKIELMVYCKDEAMLTTFIHDMSLYYQNKIGGQITQTKDFKTILISPDQNIGIEWKKVGQYYDLEIHMFQLSNL
jgi:hypothetical protein